MILNNVGKEIRHICLDQDMTLAALAKENNTSRQYISQILKRESPKIDGMIIAILETLGYDIRIEYVKREATQCASDTSV